MLLSSRHLLEFNTWIHFVAPVLSASPHPKGAGASAVVVTNLLCFPPQCCTRSLDRFASVCWRLVASSPSKSLNTEGTFRGIRNCLRLNFHCNLCASQVRRGASCAGEAGEGDRNGGDSALDRGATSGGQNLQRVLPARRPLPTWGEFSDETNWNKPDMRFFHLEAKSVASFSDVAVFGARVVWITILIGRVEMRRCLGI